MYEYILTVFGCPLTIVINKGVHFIKTLNITISVEAC
jgi:hypothetical protein